MESMPLFLRSFTRSQVASCVATGLDYALVFFCTEKCGFWYLVSVALGAIAGGVSHFLFNRHWSFEKAADPWSGQAKRYVLVSLISFFLNLLGVYCLTEWGQLHYLFSVVGISFVVGIFFNYPLHRKYVYA